MQKEPDMFEDGLLPSTVQAPETEKGMVVTELVIKALAAKLAENCCSWLRQQGMIDQLDDAIDPMSKSDPQNIEPDLRPCECEREVLAQAAADNALLREFKTWFQTLERKKYTSISDITSAKEIRGMDVVLLYKEKGETLMYLSKDAINRRFPDGLASEVVYLLHIMGFLRKKRNTKTKTRSIRRGAEKKHICCYVIKESALTRIRS